MTNADRNGWLQCLAFELATRAEAQDALDGLPEDVGPVTRDALKRSVDLADASILRLARFLDIDTRLLTTAGRA